MPPSKDASGQWKTQTESTAVSSGSGASTPDQEYNAFKPLYKFYRHMSHEDFDDNCSFTDSRPESNTLLDPLFPEPYQHLHPNDIAIATYPLTSDFINMLESFVQASTSQISMRPVNQWATTYREITLASLPGLRIYPGVLPPDIQCQLLLNVIEEYLPQDTHLTNLHAEFVIPKPFNLFTQPSDTIVPAHNGNPTSFEAIRNKKLRWVTLGGQYNWTTKKYPTFEPHTKQFPDFPESLRALFSATSDIFKNRINPEASIINFYSEGDILSPHQDVAERSNADLASVSLGCEAVFFCGLAKDKPPTQVRVRSGDIIIMGGPSRFAWHGIGKVWEGTTPAYLAEFAYTTEFSETAADPAVVASRQRYGEWIMRKRINLNIRQMLD